MSDHVDFNSKTRLDGTDTKREVPGLRTRKVDSAGTFNYVCDGTFPASPVLSDSAAIYTPGESERRGGTSKSYHGDSLSSTRGITSNTQTATDSILYDAYGMTVSRTGPTPTPFGFVGGAQYQSDSDSGLELLGHRYYEPQHRPLHHARPGTGRPQLVRVLRKQPHLRKAKSEPACARWCYPHDLKPVSFVSLRASNSGE